MIARFSGWGGGRWRASWPRRPTRSCNSGGGRLDWSLGRRRRWKESSSGGRLRYGRIGWPSEHGSWGGCRESFRRAIGVQLTTSCSGVGGDDDGGGKARQGNGGTSGDSDTSREREEALGREAVTNFEAWIGNGPLRKEHSGGFKGGGL